MKNLNYIPIICICTILLCLCCAFLLCVSNPVVVLTPFTEQMVDMYISAGWAEGARIEIRVKRIDERYIYFHIDTPPDYAAIHGTYCGSTLYRGHDIIVYGDSIDGLFWSSSIPAREIELGEYDLYEDDSGYWGICIDLLDTTIVPEMCEFLDNFPYPIDTINSMLKSQNKPICYPQTSRDIRPVNGMQ